MVIITVIRNSSLNLTYAVNRKFEGLNMVWAYKPHDDSVTIPDDFEFKAPQPIQDRSNETVGVKNDMEATERVFQLHPH